MKYYVVVKNSNNDNLGVFETFEDAVAWMEKRTAILIETFRIQVMPRKNTHDR
jgi:hypothetical protein